jgi:hypothetical protein
MRGGGYRPAKEGGHCPTGEGGRNSRKPFVEGEYHSSMREKDAICRQFRKGRVITGASSLLSVVGCRHGLRVVIMVHRCCCGRPSSPPHHIVIVCPSPSSLCGHCRCRVALSLPNVAEGEAVTWQWLAGVTMVAGWVMAFRKKKVGLTA